MLTSNMDSDSTNISTFCTCASPPPAKKIYKRNEFKDEWLQEPEFALWLEKCEDIEKANCRICQTDLAACRRDLVRHKNTGKHIQNEESARNWTLVLIKEEFDVERAENFEEMVREAELRLCVDIVEHNRTFNSFSHYIKMLRESFPDSEILSKISLKRTKIKATITNVLSKGIVAKHTEILANRYFSILIDEGTDLCDNKNKCILVRYANEGIITTYLLDYLKIRENTAENLYKCLMYTLETNNLNIKNLVGVCIDNANVMLGKHNSFVSRILATNKEVAIVPCACHCIHLAAYNATKRLPQEIIKVIDRIYTYFSRGPKRKDMLEETQKLFNIGKGKTIQLSPSRWLTLADLINRILTQWPVLIRFITETHLKDKTEIVSYIFNTLNKKLTKAYLQFLKSILTAMNKFNLLFEGKDVMIQQLLPELKRFLRFLGYAFLTEKCMTTAENLHAIDIHDNHNLLPVENIFIHNEAQETIEAIKETNEASDDEIKLFYKNIQKFYQTAYEDVLARLPLNEQFFDALGFLEPKVTLNLQIHKDQLRHILEKFPSKFDSHSVYLEWHEMASYFTHEEKNEIAELKVCDFWKKMSEIKNPIGEYRFPNITKFAELCLLIPHPNGEAERFFSMINKIKSEKRTRLKCKMIGSLTRVKLDLRAERETCISWEASQKTLEFFNCQMYKKETIPQHLIDVILPDGEDNES
nr:uncharacterized protein LOC117226439 [Megalopta genalis]